MNEISLFDFNGAEVRTVTLNGEAWFVAADIAKILGYEHTPHMARMLDDDEKGVHNVDIRSENGVEQKREVTIVNESGMYQCIMRSERQEAKAFRKWVTHDVLPALRKKGYYITETKVKELEKNLALTQGRLNSISKIKDPHKDFIDLVLAQESRDEVVNGAKAQVRIHEQFVDRTKRLLSQGVKNKELTQELHNLVRWHDATWHSLFGQSASFANTTFYPDVTY